VREERRVREESHGRQRQRQRDDTHAEREKEREKRRARFAACVFGRLELGCCKERERER
jgi:hypothetical protein